MKAILTLVEGLLKQIFSPGNELPGLKELITLFANEVAKVDRANFLNAESYQRTPQRTGFANGFKPRTFKTQLGKIHLSIPQTRNTETPFSPAIIQTLIRSEKALFGAIAEMYVNGVSTRKTTNILEQLCGLSISSSQVSEITSKLDEELTKWRNRDLSQIEVDYLYLDATYVNTRVNNERCSVALLTATAVTENGRRIIIGTDVATSEASTHWGDFFKKLKERGMKTPKLIITDAYSGLKVALAENYVGVPWQRCQFHLQQNAQKFATSKKQRPVIAEEIRTIFNAPDRPTAEQNLKKLYTYYERINPKYSQWLEENVPESLTVFSFPQEQQKKLRTSNICERINKELKRRIRVIGIFPNEASVLRLATALCCEISDEWETTTKRYMPEVKSENKEKPPTEIPPTLPEISPEIPS